METFTKEASGSMRSFISGILVFLFCLNLDAQDTSSDFRFGKRPENSIFDPTGVLTPDEQEEISKPLREVLEAEKIDILIVILPDIGEIPPQHMAKGFAEKWATTDINSVVLYVPEAEGAPWIFPGSLMSSAVKSEILKEAIDAAEKRSAAEPTHFGKVRAASIEAADAMRYWKGGARLRTEDLINRRLEWQLARERRERLLKLSLALGAAALIPLLAGFIFLYIRLKNRGARRFPSVRKLTRLGAPYSGGNVACTKSPNNQ